MPKIIATFDLEKQLFSEGYNFIIGIDEAGRGPLAGPVVASVCALRNSKIFGINKAFQIPPNPPFPNGEVDKRWDLIRDSKTLSEKQRESLFNFICENFYVGVGICDHKTIDRMNILEASFLAMKKAITNLLEANNFKFQMTNDKSQPEADQSLAENPNVQMSNNKKMQKMIVLVDGNKIIPNLSMEQRAVIGGDKIVKSISAASIIAKVTRDRIMLEMHKKYPEYDFDKHKGYGTKKHFEALKKYGPCEIHRRSFAPVKNMS